MKAIYKDLIGIYENAFSPEYCQYLISAGEKNLTPDKSRKREIEYGLYFEDISLPLDQYVSEKAMNVFNTTIHKTFEHYIERYRCMLQVIEQGYQVIDFKFQKTEPTQGYHVFHCEYDMSFGYNNRWGVWTLYLNDIEEGGETEFLYQSYRVKPKTGTLCIFPAYYTHTHRGNPPISNTKYILTGWFGYENKQFEKAQIPRKK